MRLPSVQSLLKKYGIRPKKRLGQHFLAAQPTMQKIVDALGAKGGDTVLEIGCGMGLMTAMLAQRAKHVYAVDTDTSSLKIACLEFGGDGGSLLRWSSGAVLEGSHHRQENNITWVNCDILKLDVSSYAGKRNLLVIGNIPYNISSPILFHLLDHREHISRAVLMLQKEVAERIVAEPGGKDYGALTVMLQSYATCTKLFSVARTNFIPPPQVTSSMIQINFSEDMRGRRALTLDNPPAKYRRGIVQSAAPPYDILRRVVQAAFQKRRKTLRNALLNSSLNVSAGDLDRILGGLGIDPKRRPETLSVEEFNRLAMAIGNPSIA